MRFRILWAASALVAVAASVPAQLEPGWAAYTRLYNPVNDKAKEIPGGVVLYHPYLGKNAVVTGLPATLTWEGRTGVGGANAVLVRDDDGSLLVAAAYGDLPAVIYDLTLAGTAATVRRAYAIGEPSTAATVSIDQMAWLPGNRILFSHINVNRPGLQQPTGLGILDLTTGAVTPVWIDDFPPGRFINACAVNRTFSHVYIGTYGGGGGVYVVPVTGGSAVAVPGHATLESSVQQLAVGLDGMLYLGPGWGIGKILQIDPVSGTRVELVNVVGAINAVGIEPVTGNLVFMRIASGTTPPIPEGNSAEFYWRNTTEGMVTVSGMNGYESPSGVAVRSSLLPYGGSDPRSTQAWQLHPNQGGAPRIGNLGFSLTTTSPGRDHGVLVLGLAPAHAPIRTHLMSNLLLDPTMLMGVTHLVPPSQSFTVPLPLPASLSTMDLYAQVFTLAGRGAPPLAGGQGLRIHVYE